MDGLIEWCEDLDYDKYMDNWQALATSAKHDSVPNDESLHVAGIDSYQAKTISLGGTSNANGSW